MGRLTISAALALGVVAAVAEPATRVANPDGRPLETFATIGAHAVIASAAEQASAAGLQVLRDGGNVIDAAVAVSFAVSVLRPQSTGIGGGGFLLVHWSETGRTQALDFRETAPGRAHRDLYLIDGAADPHLSRSGHLSVAVPGLVAGLSEAHRRWGQLPWPGLLEPAIQLAEEGFSVYSELARRLARSADRLARNKAAQAIFFREERPLAEGDRLIQRDLANTLRRIAEAGRAGFDHGPVARAIAEDMTRHGGLIVEEDLRNYIVILREPIRGRYRGHQIVSMPPPSSGGVHLIQMLNVLESVEVAAAGPGAANTAHWMIEAMRTAYADRSALLGDPDFVEVPVKRLTSRDYAEVTRRRIPHDRARASVEVRPALPGSRQGETTTHISILDAAGNAVSTTQTINGSFGAAVVVPGTGILLNNEMDDFSAQPGQPNLYGLLGGEANAIAPGKRPLSSMTPTIVFWEDRPLLVIGSPGGSRIITAVLQTILNVIDHDLNLLDAVARPRLHHQWMPDRVDVESGAVTPAAWEALAGLGHNVQPVAGPLGEVQAVQALPDGRLAGVSDPRRSGRPVAW